MKLKSLALACVLSTAVAAQGTKPEYRTFATPEDAVKALDAAVKAGDLAEVIALFAPEGKDLAESSDPATAQNNRQVFAVAFNEGWHLVDVAGQGANKKTLVIGNEDWPFPVPLIKQNGKWRFDATAGKEEVIARRIGRNELAAIGTCKTYVVAQERYAKDGHDGKPAGLYAAAFRSDPNKQNGLYWPDVKGQKRSPIGDLVADASAAEGREAGSPLHGYYFRILTAQGTHAPGGAKPYVVNGDMSGGHALVAWPAQYDASGVMTFLVDKSGTIRQKDLGPDTASAVKAMTSFDPDKSWTVVR
jgi:Protein of unknown function (DUF2950)